MQTFQDFLTTETAQLSVVGVVINLLLAAAMAYVLERIYVRYGSSLSNRSLFAGNFIRMTMTTMLIITVVKSSLALSLGLVGALSIVRFRAAIKEPEELSYLFLAIAIGLGLGADQRLITLVAFGVIAFFIIVKGITQRSEENENLHLTVASHNPHKVDLEEIVGVLNQHCSGVSIKRFDENNELLEASFLVEYDSFKNLQACKNALNQLGDSIKISFLDNQGLS